MKFFFRRNTTSSPLTPVQAQPGIDPGKNIVYQFAAWWLGVISLWFLVALLIVAPLTQSLGAIESWVEINWNLKWLTLVLGLAGAVPFYVLRMRGHVSGRRYHVNTINVENTKGERAGSTRGYQIKPYRPLPPVFKVWWFEVPYDIGDGLLEMPMTATGQHAPGIEPVPPTELPTEMPRDDDRVDGTGRKPEDPPDSPYNDERQGFSRSWGRDS